jgi:hypothetical protein
MSASVGESVYDFHACSFSFTSLCCACDLPELYPATCPDCCTSCGNEELEHGPAFGLNEGLLPILKLIQRSLSLSILKYALSFAFHLRSFHNFMGKNASSASNTIHSFEL